MKLEIAREHENSYTVRLIRLRHEDRGRAGLTWDEALGVAASFLSRNEQDRTDVLRTRKELAEEDARRKSRAAGRRLLEQENSRLAQEIGRLNNMIRDLVSGVSRDTRIQDLERGIGNYDNLLRESQSRSKAMEQALAVSESVRCHWIGKTLALRQAIANAKKLYWDSDLSNREGGAAAFGILDAAIDECTKEDGCAAP